MEFLTFKANVAWFVIFFFPISCWDIEISVSSLYMNFNSVSSCSFSNLCSYLTSSMCMIAQAMKEKQFLLQFRIPEGQRCWEKALEGKRCWEKGPVQIKWGSTTGRSTWGRQNSVCLACVVLTFRRHLFLWHVVTWLTDGYLSLQSCVELQSWGLCTDVWSSAPLKWKN